MVNEPEKMAKFAQFLKNLCQKTHEKRLNAEAIAEKAGISKKTTPKDGLYRIPPPL
jgi:hypothetical protein